MTILALALRYLSCVFSLILGLFLTGVSTVLLVTGAGNAKLDMFPFWKGPTAIYGMLVLGLVGILAAILSVIGKAKPLLVLFTLVAFSMIVYGFFINTRYVFSGADQAKSLVWLAVAALVAFFGSLAQFASPRRA